MGYTFSEKAIGKKAGRTVRAGECVIVPVDVVMASDTTGPIAIKAFQDMGGKRPAKPLSHRENRKPAQPDPQLLPRTGLHPVRSRGGRLPSGHA